MGRCGSYFLAWPWPFLPPLFCLSLSLNRFCTVAPADEETEEEWLARDLKERQLAIAQSHRRAVSREAEVGACEHNLALLQMLLGRPADEWGETLARSLAAVGRAEALLKAERRSRAKAAGGGEGVGEVGLALPAAVRMYISKIRKTEAVLGRVAKAHTATKDQLEAEQIDQQDHQEQERPSTVPGGSAGAGGSTSQTRRPWTPQAPFDATVRITDTACAGQRPSTADSSLPPPPRRRLPEHQRSDSGSGSGPRLQQRPRTGEFCITNDECCIKNDELCMYNDEFCI